MMRQQINQHVELSPKMAKISVLTIAPELEASYLKNLKPQDRFTYSRVTMKQVFYSRRRKKGLTQKTLLPQISDLWNNLTDEQKTAWADAGFQSNMTGFRLFVQDTTKRIIADLPGLATPSELHQSNVGAIRIEAPATKIRLIQIHPNTYYKIKKVTGTKAQYEPIKQTELFSLPFTIGMNYKADFTVAGPNPYANLYATIITSYQGVDRYTQLDAELLTTTDWTNTENTLTSILGYFIAYDLYIEVNDLQGELLFDNVIAEHTSQNWVRDPRCNSIDTTFTRAFYQIPKNWTALEIPDGAAYDSIYPED